jgi:hypothetical protein
VGTAFHSGIAGLFGALMTAMRPVESVIPLCVLLPFVLVRAIQSKVIALRDTIIVVTLFTLPALVLLVSMWVRSITPGLRMGRLRG